MNSQHSERHIASFLVGPACNVLLHLINQRINLCSTAIQNGTETYSHN